MLCYVKLWLSFGFDNHLSFILMTGVINERKLITFRLNISFLWVLWPRMFFSEGRVGVELSVDGMCDFYLDFDALKSVSSATTPTLTQLSWLAAHKLSKPQLNHNSTQLNLNLT